MGEERKLEVEGEAGSILGGATVQENDAWGVYNTGVILWETPDRVILGPPAPPDTPIRHGGTTGVNQLVNPRGLSSGTGRVGGDWESKRGLFTCWSVCGRLFTFLGV